MDMKRHMLICFFISMLVDREKKWNSYKMEVIIFVIVFGMVHGWPYEGFQKLPHTPISIICHYN
jgi:hypothetical protein